MHAHTHTQSHTHTHARTAQGPLRFLAEQQEPYTLADYEAVLEPKDTRRGLTPAAAPQPLIPTRRSQDIPAAALISAAGWSSIGGRASASFRRRSAEVTGDLRRSVESVAAARAIPGAATASAVGSSSAGGTNPGGGIIPPGSVTSAKSGLDPAGAMAPSSLRPDQVAGSDAIWRGVGGGRVCKPGGEVPPACAWWRTW